MENSENMLVKVLTLMRDLARAQHAGESGEIADRADLLLTEVGEEFGKQQEQED